MLTRHHGLLILLLFAVAAHATLVQRWLGREPPWMQIGFAILFAPIVLALLGEWIAGDATTPTWQRRGWMLALLGAGWHLLLDALCLVLLNQQEGPRLLLIGGAVLGAAVMSLVLRRAWKGIQDPAAPEPDLSAPAKNETAWGRIAREAALFGGTPLVLILISLGFVVMAGVGMARNPHAWAKLVGAGGFFALCGLVGVWMGLERRAMHLRQPSPFAGLRPRWMQRSLVVAAQDGLALLDRKGATLYAYEDIRAVSLGELQGNAAVFIELSARATPRRLSIDGTPLPEDAAWLRKQAWNRNVQQSLCGCDLALMGVMTRSGPGVLAEEIGTLLTDYEARALRPTAAQALADFLRPTH